MRLQHISLSNHRRVHDFSVEVREHLVVIGPNGVGKTAILRILNMLLGSTAQQLSLGLSIADLRDKTRSLCCRTVLGEFTDDERAVFPDEISVDQNHVESLTVEMHVDASSEGGNAVAIRRFFPESGHERSPTREQIDSIGWRYLPSNRSTASDYMDGRRSPLRVMLGATDLGDGKEELGAILARFNDCLDGNDALRVLRSQIAFQLSRSLPQEITTDHLELRTAADPHEGFLDAVTLFLNLEDELRSLGEQSDGIRQILAMTFFDLAGSAANIVAIDEPELHLHPSSQRNIADLFAGGQSQRIVSTHSPYIVHRFEPKHVVSIAKSRGPKANSIQ